jgi:hypothetical protein
LPVSTIVPSEATVNFWPPNRLGQEQRLLGAACAVGDRLGSVFSPTQEEASTAIDPFFSVLAGLVFGREGV